jgi:hypothetical protein
MSGVIKMKKFLIIPLIAVLAACNSTSTIKPVIQDRPDLVLPKLRPVQQRPVNWTILTRKNLEAKLAQIEKKGGSVTLVATTPEGYKNMSLNAAELRRFIQEQGAQIDALKEYYEAPVEEAK